MEVSARYVPGTALLLVGGDWYDALLLPEDRAMLVVGDVVGHGLDAAVAMGQLRTALVALAPAHPPAALLTELDAFLARTGVSDFASVCVAVYDPASGELEYAAAGHPFTIAVSLDGGVRRLDAAQSGPLGGPPTPPGRKRSRLSSPELH